MKGHLWSWTEMPGLWWEGDESGGAPIPPNEEAGHEAALVAASAANPPAPPDPPADERAAVFELGATQARVISLESVVQQQGEELVSLRGAVGDLGNSLSSLQSTLSDVITEETQADHSQEQAHRCRPWELFLGGSR